MRLLFVCIALFCFGTVHAQVSHSDDFSAEDYDNIKVEKIQGDSLASSFMIWVKDTVKTHKHERHSEHVYVLEGQGTFYLHNQKYEVGPGDVIFIPHNTWHAVKVVSKEPMKVISVQSPGFYGKDRIFKDH